MESYRDLGTYDRLSGFEGAQGKIVRVRYQLRDLQERFQTFGGSHPYRLVPKFELRPGGEKIGDYSFVVESVSLPKREWGVLIGEIVHNLRSALDHTIWAASSKPSRKTQFPIFTSKTDWDKHKGHLMIATVPDQVRKFVIEAQPYSQTKLPASQHVLAVLNRLSNHDKHRLLHTAAITLEGASPGVEGTGQFGTIREIVGNFGPLEPGQTMIRIVLEDPPPEPTINLYGEFSLGVAFTDPTGEDAVLHGSPVMENLLNIYRYVGDLVTRVEFTCKTL